MFLNSSLKVALGSANVTGITVCTSKLVNNIGLKKFRDLQLKKLPIFNGENATTILVFLQYLSQIYLSLSLVVFEKVPVYGNLKYTFLL